jgi:hypothetical protein
VAARALLAAYVVGAAALTLGPLPERLYDWTSGEAAALTRTVSGGVWAISPVGVERTANVLLLVPVGALLSVAWPRQPMLRLLAYCAAAAVCVEGYQWLTGLGRYSSVSDVLLNSLGAGLGLAGGRLPQRPSRRDPPKRLA